MSGWKWQRPQRVDVPNAASRALLDVARDDPATTLCVTSQILCEFYSVVTNPRQTPCKPFLASSRSYTCCRQGHAPSKADGPPSAAAGDGR